MAPLREIALGVFAAGLLLAGSTFVRAQATPVGIRNIVLVHGAFVDGSGWQPVYDMLVKDGYAVSVVQEPLTSLADDVAATKRVLAQQPGPCILVAHSYGGTVITEAGNDSHVVGLVYIAAHMPAAGENEAANSKRMPTAGHPPLKTPDGFLYLNPVYFYEDFAPDLPRGLADFEARAQVTAKAEALTTPVTAPAWKTKPSWWRVPTASSTPIWNACTPRGPTASKWKSRGPAIRSTGRTPRK